MGTNRFRLIAVMIGADQGLSVAALAGLILTFSTPIGCAGSGPIVWDKTFGGQGTDWPYCIQQTADGGYIIAGETSSKGAGFYDAWVLKLNSQGNLLWDKTLGGRDFDTARSIQQTADGGYIVTGYTKSKGAGREDVWVIKLGRNGTVLWDKTFGASGFDEAYCVQETRDGNYIVAGCTNSEGAGGLDFWVIKLSDSGLVIWDKTFGTSESERPCGIQKTADGNYVVAGNTGFDIWVIKLNSDGVLLWDKRLGAGRYNNVGAVRQSRDGGCFVAGKTGPDVRTIRLDSQGTVLWDKTFGTGGSYDIHSMEATRDGGCLIAGNAGSGDFWLLKVSSSGELLGEKIFVADGYDVAQSVQQTSDGGYILTGYAAWPKGPNRGDIWVIRLTEDIRWNKPLGLGDSWVLKPGSADPLRWQKRSMTVQTSPWGPGAPRSSVPSHRSNRD